MGTVHDAVELRIERGKLLRTDETCVLTSNTGSLLTAAVAVEDFG